MTSAIGDNRRNIYCKGKKKSGHVNYSWFRGICRYLEFTSAISIITVLHLRTDRRIIHEIQAR